MYKEEALAALMWLKPFYTSNGPLAEAQCHYLSGWWGHQPRQTPGVGVLTNT